MNLNGAGTSGTDAISPSRGLVLFASSTLGFALLIALSARMSLPVPGTPVPASLQAFSVLLAGAFLGPWGGVASVGTYLLAGMAGAPVFALGGGPGYLLGPTGGYLVGLLPAAWLAGRVSRGSARVSALFPGFLLAVLIIHLFGWTQLSLLAGTGAAMRLGVFPFLAFDVLKALLAAGVVKLYRARAPRLGTRGGTSKW
jgi:biotin transport system substrate-specific component